MTDPGTGRALLRRVAEGDPAALATVYETYERMVYYTARGLLHEEADAKDILHDVFLGLPQAVSKYSGHGSFEGWLRKVTRNAALMAMRKRDTRNEVSLGTPEESYTSRRAESIVERIAIDDALASLSEEQRVVYVLKEKEGYSHPEIAKELGISRLASRSRHMRAMRQLRRLLGDD